MTQHSLTTRLGEYISLVLPDAHGHQQKAVTDFVLAVVMVQSCCQARLARFFDNFESASKRLWRLIHNPRLATDELALSHARALVARLPTQGGVRLALDWTIEDRQHLFGRLSQCRATRCPALLACLQGRGLERADERVRTRICACALC